ncbi:MAG TPA: HAMP domain-containing sensor histidine kinase [Methanospirillum sp.]|nr:HAMP domain-containing sensor histidine kinase [Methanospirillum sp.]
MLTRLIRNLHQKFFSPQKKETSSPFNSSEHLQIVLDSVDALIYVSDLDTYEILFINQYGRQVFGNITGKTCWKALQANQSGPCPFCTNEQLITQDGSPAQIVVWEFQNTISGRWYQCRDRVIRWTDGKFVRMEIATDITGGKLYEEQIERLNAVKEELRSLYNDLEDRVTERTAEITRIQESFQEANTKLNLLNSITRHDILNQITALNGYLELSRELSTDEEQRSYIEKAEHTVEVIDRHIHFTRVYEEIGVHSPIWQPIQEAVGKAIRDVSPISKKIRRDLSDFEVYGDPLLERVFYTLIENTLRHGGEATIIRFSNHITSEGMILTYEDNGPGIADDDKKRIFERGYGRNTGFGLYLAREVLAMTDMIIREVGEKGRGVRFEIAIPEYNYRLSQVDE